MPLVNRLLQLSAKKINISHINVNLPTKTLPESWIPRMGQYN